MTKILASWWGKGGARHREERRNHRANSFLEPWHHSLILNLLHSGSDTSHRDRHVSIHPREARSRFVQSEFFNTTGSLCLNVLSLWCLNKGSAWETRSQSCIISFLGLGQETRKSPEGTLIRSRKQHKELSFSPTGKSTQPSKTSNLVWSLYIASQTPRPPPLEPTQCICRLQYTLKGSRHLPFYGSKPHT